MRRALPRRLAAACLALPVLSGCAAANFTIAGAGEPGPDYDSQYPIYLEYCADSAIDKKPGFGARIVGGSGGHASFYLNGACRDPREAYPVVAMCADLPPTAWPDAPVLPADAMSGTGISMDGNFINATWVATPGRSFFDTGGLSPGEPLTRARYARVQAEARRLDILTGIRFDPAVYADKPAGMSREDYEYDISIGTDYAVGLARGRYCVRVPLVRDQMVRMVGFLNGVNARYRHGPATYDASVFQDNCVHLPHNALAAADIMHEWPTGMFLPVAIFDFPVPKNDFVNIVRRTNDLPLGDLAALFHDTGARQELLTYGRLPTEPGATSFARPAWPDNDVYETRLGLIFYDQPLAPYARHFAKIFSDPRYFDLAANRRHFDALYARLRADRRPLTWWLPLIDPADHDAFAAFYARFYAAIDPPRS